MSVPAQLETPRLILRRWHESDIKPFAEMNGDPEVMEFFPKPLTFDETEIMIHSIEKRFDDDDFGLWAVDIKETGEFIGFVGLIVPHIFTHFTPCVEIGWRLGKQFWGRGYAPEAAQESLRDVFDRLSLPEVVSMTAVLNKRSMRVMEKLKMHRTAEDDFDHPMVDDGHPLQPHVLYRLTQDEWRQQGNI